MIILSAEETRKALPMDSCIKAMKDAFQALSEGNAMVPLRSRISLEEREGTSLFMPAHISKGDPTALAVKIVSVFNKNPDIGLPLIHAAVLVLDEETGAVEALIEGASLTAIRTGAGSGAATDLLAASDASVLALFGAGVQAATQLEAVCAVRDIREVRVYSPDREGLAKFLVEQGKRIGGPQKWLAAKNPQETLAGADVVCTATTSSEAVFEDQDIAEGMHINAVGAYTPEMSEIPSGTMRRARVFVDSMEAAGVEAGEITQNIAGGSIQLEEIAEIGKAFSRPELGRQDEQEITLFKSVGVAVQDAAAGRLALDNARKMGLGTEVNL